MIPNGIVEVSPGSRSESDENPGIFDIRGIRPRQWVTEVVKTRDDPDASGTPFRVQIQKKFPVPGWSSLSLLDPGLPLFDPYRDQEVGSIMVSRRQATCHHLSSIPTGIKKWVPIIESLKALDFSRRLTQFNDIPDDANGDVFGKFDCVLKMAEELYREWFVRPRLPGYQQTKVVKGVPEGWSVKELQDVA